MGCQKNEAASHFMLHQYENGRFPVIKEHRIPFGGGVVFSTTELIYCICRMPYGRTVDMIQCNTCSMWFHNNCVAIKELNTFIKKDWFCDE